MFYEDQHKLAAYLERHPDAEWEYWAGKWYGHDDGRFKRASEAFNAKYDIRPVLRYGLPSHLQSEIHNPDNLTEEQICEGGKYRAVLKSESASQPHEYCNKGYQEWRRALPGDQSFENYRTTYRLPATVPWPDWELTKATPWPEWPDPENEKPDPKDARIAELEKQVSELHESCKNLRETCSKIASPWRRMSEVPTEEDADKDGCVPVIDYTGAIRMLVIERWAERKLGGSLVAWMPAPKFHGWPDPLADLLKQHGVEATPELTAALTAWKGVEK